MEAGGNLPGNDKKVLTSIHETYTLSNTREEDREIDRLIVKNFQNCLAEVALAIAARKANSSMSKRE